MKPITPAYNNQQRLYNDLAWVWPIISPREEYIPETELFCEAIRKHSQIPVKTLLDLGCGGGHNDYVLKKHFEVTGIDISVPMLELAKQLNPEATYLPGDMRTVKLDKTFDAVTVFDSINYMLTVEDLKAAFMTAYQHLKPGGVFLALVEETPENFQQNWTLCSTYAKDGVEIAFIENYYDPDPADTTFEATLVYLIRCEGQLKIETDRHLCGIFKLETWHHLLEEVRFEVRQDEFTISTPYAKSYPMFICIKPHQ